MISDKSLSSKVVTVVTAGLNALDPTWVRGLAKQFSITDVVWLAEHEAVDLYFEAWSDDIKTALIKKLLEIQCDFFVQPTTDRRKRLMVADMESTIIQQEMLDELADIIGLRTKVADITQRAMNGELDFKEALRERVRLLTGQPEAILDHVKQRITLMPGARQLVATMKAHGAQCWLVSGGFTCFVDPVGAQLGFDRMCANTLIVHNHELTGDVKEPILDKGSKKIFLEEACQRIKISLAQSLAVGDGANDVPMLAACHAAQGLGVAYHAKPNVRAVVPHQINYGNLTTLLYAQGYTKAEFCS